MAQGTSESRRTRQDRIYDLNDLINAYSIAFKNLNPNKRTKVMSNYLRLNR